MKKFICITGKIASGKSTAMSMLQHRSSTATSDYMDMHFIDLDKFSKNLYSDSMQDNPITPDGIELKSFFDNVFAGEFPTPKAIVDKVFADHVLYNTYCGLYENYLVSYLDNLPDATYIVEASAVFSYKKIYDMMDLVMVIHNNANRDSNLKKRKIDNANVYDCMFDSHAVRYLLDDKIVSVSLSCGTYMEMRAKVEFALVEWLAATSDSSYYDGIAEVFNAINYKMAWHGDQPYHNKNHAIGVFTDLVLSGRYNIVNGYAAIYHDWVYNPQSFGNENLSSIEAANALANQPFVDDVVKLIKSTSYKEINKDNYDFFLSDISHWNKTADEIIEAEKLVFKEYQHVDFNTYRTARIGILRSIIDNPSLHEMPMQYVRGLLTSIAWLNSYEPKIGWLCGSFNPFTIGHMDILTRAEQMFDKVVLVQAQNPSKTSDQISLTDCKKLEKYEKYTGITNLIELINSVTYTPVLIRGIRTPQDLIDNESWINQINEFVAVDMVNIVSSTRFKHISSSFVNSCRTIGLDSNKFTI